MSQLALPLPPLLDPFFSPPHTHLCGPAGAGDDASNVGVMLEMATNLLSSPLEDIPEHPLLFLFSGAEEPLCQVGWAGREAWVWVWVWVRVWVRVRVQVRVWVWVLCWPGVHHTSYPHSPCCLGCVHYKGIVYPHASGPATFPSCPYPPDPPS